MKVFSVEIYFQAIRYRTSGHGALGYRKFAKVFSAKIYFQAIRESFLPRKKPATLYVILSVAREGTFRNSIVGSERPRDFFCFEILNTCRVLATAMLASMALENREGRE